MIKRLSDTLSDLVKLIHGEFNKYNLSPSKINIIFFKDKWIQNGPKVIMVLSDTLSNINKLNYGK